MGEKGEWEDGGGENIEKLKNMGSIPGQVGKKVVGLYDALRPSLSHDQPHDLEATKPPPSPPPIFSLHQSATHLVELTAGEIESSLNRELVQSWFQLAVE